MEETGIKLVIFCTGNMIEDAPYKTGLMGVPQDDHGNVLTKMSLRNKAGILNIRLPREKTRVSPDITKKK